MICVHCAYSLLYYKPLYNKRVRILVAMRLYSSAYILATKIVYILTLYTSDSLIKENLTSAACNSTSQAGTKPPRINGSISAHLVAGDSHTGREYSFIQKPIIYGIIFKYVYNVMVIFRQHFEYS